ncbi:MAG: hypothetical protein HOK82_22805 [Rhodospirillaceae bacterium]|nr:hypothetical protein [Rhodospirillaceae bacterium]
MGGNLPLGYDAPTDTSRALVVNDAEADTVRRIFEAYLELASVHALQRWLDKRGIRSKSRTTRSGKIIGGQLFSRGALFHLLRNRTYLGLIVHKSEAYPGLHAAIVDPALFDAVQTRLDANAQRHKTGKDRISRAPLTGRLFDNDDQPMSPSFTYGKRGQVYRYYVSAPLLQGCRLPGDVGIRRVPGPALEAMVSAAIRRLMPASTDDPLALSVRIEVHPQSLQLLLPIDMLARMSSRLAPGETAEPEAADGALLRLTLPISLRRRGGRSWIIGAAEPAVRRDPALIKALRTAHAIISTDAAGLPRLNTAPSSPYLRRLVRLAFLAPELQRAILAGKQPPGLTLEQLMRTPMPILWSDQAAMFDSLGVSRPPGKPGSHQP